MQVGHRYKVNKYKTVASLTVGAGGWGGVLFYTRYANPLPPSCMLLPTASALKKKRMKGILKENKN